MTHLVEDGSIRLMADWLYREAGQLTKIDDDLWLTLLNYELVEPLRAFKANIDRTREFWRLHPHLVEQASFNVALLCKTIWEMTGKPLLSDEQAHDAELCAAITGRIAQQFESRYKETGSKELAAGYDFERALERFGALIQTDSKLGEAVYATLATQTVSAWTAFEILASDLWAAILACNDQAVAEPGKHSFQTLWKLRTAYAALLPNSPKIDTILLNTDLRKLNLIRNVLIHKAGRVDQAFLDGAETIKWTVIDQLGQDVILDGHRVKSLINPVVQVGIEFIRAVDSWITNERQVHKEGSEL